MEFRERKRERYRESKLGKLEKETEERGEKKWWGFGSKNQVWEGLAF